MKRIKKKMNNNNKIKNLINAANYVGSKEHKKTYSNKTLVSMIFG